MVDVDPRRQQLREAFSAELDDHVRALNQMLLRLERPETGDQECLETLDALFREAHSLKGAARAVELGSVEELAHALESALDAARKVGLWPGAAWFDAVYRSADAVGGLYRAWVQREPPTVDAAEVAATLRRLAGESSAAVAPAAAAALPGARLPGSVPAQQDGKDGGPRPGAPPPPPTAPSGASPGSAAAAESIRVAVRKLDELLAQAGELAVTRIRIDRRLRELQELQRSVDGRRRDSGPRAAARIEARLQNGGSLDGQARRELLSLVRASGLAEQRNVTTLGRLADIIGRFRSDTTQLAQVTRAIEEEVMAVRLLAVSTILDPLERIVRDLCRSSGKEARLVIDGADTELDRRILEQIRDPLMHMLRNAIDHGIEPPEVREALGKPRSGTVTVSVEQRGGTVEIRLRDDGAGLDPARLRAAAVAKGLLSETEASALSEREAMELIFHPGFTTSALVTDTSGRGVGMDVVRERIDALNGHIRLSSRPGVGTQFALRLPLTLATTRAVLAIQSGQVLAMPSALVERNSRIRGSEIVEVEGQPTVIIEGHPVPVVELADILETPHRAPDDAEWRSFVVLRLGERRAAFLVDSLAGEQEIVVKNLAWPIRRLRNVSGVAVLGTGEIVVILNPSDLLKTAYQLVASKPRSAPVNRGPSQGAARRHRLLVVDDSVTTRTLERSILEAAGYEVSTAVDGVEALVVLREQQIDLVISDVDMPRMDGFDFTAEIRRDEHLRSLPVILVTSLEGSEHRARGVQVGADAYIVKSGFDQVQLIDTIRRLL